MGRRTQGLSLNMLRWLATGTVVLAMMTLVITEMSTHPVPRRRLASRKHNLMWFQDLYCKTGGDIFTDVHVKDGKLVMSAYQKEDIHKVSLVDNGQTIEVKTSKTHHYFKPTSIG